MSICEVRSWSHGWPRIKSRVDSEFQSMDDFLPRHLTKSFDDFLLQVVQLALPH